MKLAKSCAALLLIAAFAFVLFKLDKWEVLPVRLWKASYDRTSPKGALFFMRRALLTGDAEGYTSSFELSEEDEALRQALKKMVLGFANLRIQMTAAYGQVNADVATRNLAPAVLPEKFIHSADEMRNDNRVLISLGPKQGKMINVELIQSMKSEPFFNSLPLQKSQNETERTSVTSRSTKIRPT